MGNHTHMHTCAHAHAHTHTLKHTHTGTHSPGLRVFLATSFSHPFHCGHPYQLLMFTDVLSVISPFTCHAGRMVKRPQAAWQEVGRCFENNLICIPQSASLCHRRR